MRCRLAVFSAKGTSFVIAKDKAVWLCIGSLLFANGANFRANFGVNVFAWHSHLAANIALTVASVIEAVRQSLSNIAAPAASSLAGVGILMLVRFANGTAEVAILVTRIRICMLLGYALKATDGAIFRAGMLKGVGNFSQLSASVTIRVAGAFIFMTNISSDSSAFIAVYIKARGILVWNGISRISARITYGVTAIIVNMICFSCLFTQVTGRVASVIKGMRRFALFVTF